MKNNQFLNNGVSKKLPYFVYPLAVTCVTQHVSDLISPTIQNFGHRCSCEKKKTVSPLSWNYTAFLKEIDFKFWSIS